MPVTSVDLFLFHNDTEKLLFSDAYNEFGFEVQIDPRRRIRQHLHLIIAASDDASVLGDESTDRDLFGGGCLSCQPQGFAHECLIIPEQ